jgi:HSP20 family molecular chaperone IbpA
MAMAGIDKDTCSINIENNELILNIGNLLSASSPSDEPNNESKSLKKEYIQKQISGRSAVMRWTLGNKIDKDNISVKYKNGILKITLPFVHFLEKASREIPID